MSIRQSAATAKTASPGSYLMTPSAYVSIRQHTSAYVSIRQHTSAYSITCLVLDDTLRKPCGCDSGSVTFGQTEVHGRRDDAQSCRIQQLTSASVSIRQHPSAYGIRQHTSAYVSIRQHTSAYVRIPADISPPAACTRAMVRRQLASTRASPSRCFFLYLFFSMRTRMAVWCAGSFLHPRLPAAVFFIYLFFSMRTRMAV